VAREMYGLALPVVVVGRSVYDQIQDGRQLELSDLEVTVS